jgi:large subunit ribosomal protein L10
MNRTEKQELVDELRKNMEGASTLFYTDFTGLNVKGMTELRRRLRKAGVQYKVIKNTLAVRAVNESGLTGTKLRGPTGVVIGKDPVAAAKVLADFAKEFEQRPAVKGGLLDGRVLMPAQVKQLSTMPTRDRMLAIAIAARGVCRRAERPAVHVRRGAHRAAHAARGAAPGVTVRATVRLAVTGRHG